MENININLISGGYFHCTSDWNEEPSGKDQCYKIYFPVEGSAKVYVDGDWYELESGNAYYINGFLLEKQICEDYMKVYWIHFLPESPLLCINLNHMKAVHCWNNKSNIFDIFEYVKIPELFDNPYSRKNTLSDLVFNSYKYFICGAIIILISKLIEEYRENFQPITHENYLKLQPALEHMLSNYKNNPDLEEIAQKSFMNPIYFIRLFKKYFKITPGKYLNLIKLNEASRLLNDTGKSIEEIAEATGFCNQFYFSKVFKEHFGKSPRGYRKTEFLP